MDNSIENIWKKGFENEELLLPKINRLYSRKSISYVEKIIEGFKREVILLLPLSFFVFCFNAWILTEHAFLWAAVYTTPCFIWFFIGKAQIKALSEINYQSNPYDYLISIRKKLKTIWQFNKRLAVTSIPVILAPMLVYTYYNQAGKTIGEIFGVEGLNFPTEAIFLLLPLLTLVAALIAQVTFKRAALKNTKELNALIQDMEELKG